MVIRSCIVGIIAVLSAVGASAQDAPRPASSPDRHYTLSTCVNEFTPARIESTKAGYQYWFVGKEFLDGRTLKMSVVKPRAATHPPHRHAEDEFFFVLEGTAEVILNGETRIVHPYTSFYCPSDSLHGIRNPGDGELKYLVIKKYGAR